MSLNYFFIFLVAFSVSLILTVLAMKYLPQYGWMDRNEAHSTHRKATPRGGGIVIFLVFSVLVLALVNVDKHVLGLLLGGALVFLVNFVDDKTNRISPWMRLGFEFIAALIIIGSGIGMVHITNPFSGEAIALDLLRFPVTLGGQTHYFVPIADFFTIVWILVLVNMMNWLDGLDGLATGVSIICTFTLFGLSLLPFVDQPEMAKMAMILAGALGAFLIFNFSPAKIKLGDAGSTFIGFVLAVLAIFASGKIAVFFLVLGLPLLDVVWVILRRILVERRSPFKGDTKHFHHRLMAAGFSVRQTVLIIYTFCAAFGMIALTLQGAQLKLLAILTMTAMMVVFGLWLVYKGEKK